MNTPSRTLVRPTEGRMVAGVCKGLADHLGIDVTLLRVLVVLGTIFGLGSLLVAYVVMWLLVPEAAPQLPVHES